MHQTFWKPEKQAKEKKVYNSLQQRKPKAKRDVPEWKKDILSHHTSRPSTRERGEFPKEVITELITESSGVCQHCKAAEATTTHHVMPHWISVYRDKYGEYFWFDEQDWEEYNRKQEAIKAAEEEKRERMNQIKPVAELISTAAGRSLKAKELRLLEGFDDKEMAVFASMISDLVATHSIKPSYAYGERFED
ncbi:HNH endonuclease [Paenibacillus aceti]|uniref:HNH endonuclease n=1 Tax=Paenibacillus aceti TaxID=1820010 RepID=A0ABQ1VPB9_9BACL|nr:HNH endonuclease [Paenibacillus aceti]GGF86595.1 hypothetical protein GCM10010913_05150 [Paenibacillus aceti]